MIAASAGALLRRHEYELKSGSTVSVKEIELFLAARHGAMREAEIEEILLREAYEVLEELAEGLPT